jgi:hypothetical protein
MDFPNLHDRCLVNAGFKSASRRPSRHGYRWGATLAVPNTKCCSRVVDITFNWSETRGVKYWLHDELTTIAGFAGAGGYAILKWLAREAAVSFVTEAAIETYGAAALVAGYLYWIGAVANQAVNKRQCLYLRWYYGNPLAYPHSHGC